MLRNSICFLILFSLSQLLQSQEIALYSNYINNNFYNINPAAAGFDGAFISQLTVSKRWFGISESPTHQIFSSSIRLGEEEFYDPNMFINRPIIDLAPRVGIGLTLFNETTGPLRHTGFLFAYAYHISIRENRLSFGLSGSVSQYHLNTQEFKPVTADDPGLTNDNNSEMIPDINFGALYYNSRLFTGVSALELMNINKVMDHRRTSPDIVVCGGYKFILNPRYKFEPSLFLWRYGKGTYSFDINTKLFFRDKNYLLLSYRNNREVIAGFGISIRNGLRIGYTFTISTSGMATYNAGSHSVSLQANIAALIQNHK